MLRRKSWLAALFLLALVGGVSVFFWKDQASLSRWFSEETGLEVPSLAVSEIPSAHPLSIAALKVTPTPGSEISLERTLPATATYTQAVVSYESEGNTIQALLTIPRGEQPATGWPVIIFNHGYIPPDQYSTTQRYEAYVGGFASQGYIVFKPDYRGHGQSEGEAAGGYGSNAYTIDVLNAVSSIAQHPAADANRIGMWGHSMGGFITLRAMVVEPRIQAGVIWGGVVASYPDLINNWRRRSSTPPPLPPNVQTQARRWRDRLQEEFGTPDSNPEFWQSLSANTYVADLGGRPIALHHGTADDSVPVWFSETLHAQLQAAGQVSELHTYPGDNHNISGSFSTAMRRSVAFFDQYVKNRE